MSLDFGRIPGGTGRRSRARSPNVAMPDTKRAGRPARPTANHEGWTRTRRVRDGHGEGTNARRLFDDLIGAQQQRRRNGEAERFSGLEIYDELEFRRLFDRQISGLRPFQDLVDECRGAAVDIADVRAV
jgi:hypothetical protein